MIKKLLSETFSSAISYLIPIILSSFSLSAIVSYLITGYTTFPFVLNLLFLFLVFVCILILFVLIFQLIRTSLIKHYSSYQARVGYYSLRNYTFVSTEQEKTIEFKKLNWIYCSFVGSEETYNVFSKHKEHLLNIDGPFCPNCNMKLNQSRTYFGRYKHFCPNRDFIEVNEYSSETLEALLQNQLNESFNNKST